MIKDNRNSLLLIVLILTVVLTVSLGTYSYWTWRTSDAQDTNIIFTTPQKEVSDYSCTGNGGGNIDSSSVTLMPTSNCANSTYAIKRTIDLSAWIELRKTTIWMDLWLNIDYIAPELSESTNFKYVLTRTGTTCSDRDYILTSGTFKGKESGDRITLLNKEEITSNIDDYTYSRKVYLYIWMDGAETNPNTQNKDFQFSLSGNCADEHVEEIREVLNGADPVLESGMIPVNISNTGAVSTAGENDVWYDYESKKWANAVLVTSDSRSNYYEDDDVTIKSNVTIPENNILAYFVWIPKFSYRINNPESAISIAFNDTPSGFIEHPAFNFEENMTGFWVGKFETGHSSLLSSSGNTLGCSNLNCERADGLIVKPNITSKRNDRVASQFYASRSMTRESNPFGLVASEIDSHMMNNSEWGAVAYLSHSRYGLNREVRINNSSTYITGCGATEENGAMYAGCQTPYGSVSSGQYLQSTTGNITGIFDMSGGANEYVMAYYINANANFASNPNSYFGYTNTANSAGFTTLIDSLYWSAYGGDNYTNACDGGICYGAALSETAGWYDDYAYYLLAKFPWLCRGGYYEIQSGAGLFLFAYYYGSAGASYSFRLVLAPLNQT